MLLLLKAVIVISHYLLKPPFMIRNFFTVQIGKGIGESLQEYGNHYRNTGIFKKIREFSKKYGNFSRSTGILKKVREFSEKYGNFQRNTGILAEVQEF